MACLFEIPVRVEILTLNISLLKPEKYSAKPNYKVLGKESQWAAACKHKIVGHGAEWAATQSC